ncbi:Clavaminate synthase-like protein [Coniochaeta ligniaria NRRL 30616]|uniref:Clavaminate synthase-like protein n=1 Tax=Coniochaeta ligniaria NRRL 30616 TaxID=1408157 RepID=A0A1J7J727_9PEZI|nr:Clavaminate synthase-like protein [Coniochaeta ligniaria NRRL 30616]
MGSLAENPHRTVRTLDFSDFLQGDSTAQKLFCEELVDALCSVGFVKLINHGISDEAVDEVFEWNRRFFALPPEAKAKAAHPAQPNPHRGYSYVGQEKLSRVKDYEKGVPENSVAHDIKESFDQGPVDDDLYPNRWPDEADLPHFRRCMESFYSAYQHVHMDLLRALAIGLHLRPGFLQDLCRHNTSEMRLNHYPAVDAAALRKDGATKRISEHTDFGTVTLLFQDAVGGLEVEDQTQPGCYFPVPAPDWAGGGPREMIINIGDCFQRWTGDRLRATSHRVVLPPEAGEWIEDRYSVAYFGKPNRSQSVATLPEFVRPGEEPKYHSLTAWEYMQKKLALTY